MAARNSAETGPSFNERCEEEVGRLRQLMEAVKQQGNFVGFAIAQLQEMKVHHPGITDIINDSIKEQTTLECKEEVFWCLWGTAMIARTLINEFGEPNNLQLTEPNYPQLPDGFNLFQN